VTNHVNETDPSDGPNSPHPSRVESLHPGLLQVKDWPELIPVLGQAVDEVINNNFINRERYTDLVDEMERAAAAAALTAYMRLDISSIQVNDAAHDARRVQAYLVAATAQTIAARVIDAAAEIHHVEDAAAAHVASVAASAASELAELIGPEDETVASAAAALVVKAVNEAAAVNTEARADAATIVAQAAAEAAADVAEAAASTASAVESDFIANALDGHQDALEACFKVAAAAAQAMLTHRLGTDLLTRPSPA
jgi:hypothetical protein